MKTFALLVSIMVSVSAALAGEVPVSSDPIPFHSVTVSNNVILATLPDSPRWIVAYGIDDRRQTKPGESFTLKDGASLLLAEHHLSYQVTAQLAPTPGLKIESRFNASSFGRTNTDKSYFIPAK